MNQLIKFILVGIVATLINFLTYFICMQFNISVVIAAILGYITGLCFSFIFGKNWVFNNNDPNFMLVLIKFIFVYVTGLLIHTLLTYLLESKIDYKIAWLIGTFFSTVNNFLGSKYLAFKNND